MSNVFSRFEDNIDNAVDTAAGTVFKAPIEPAQIAKKAEKQMKRNRLVGAGRQYAPTLYNVLVNSIDDQRLFGFYPTMAAEIETYLMARGTDAGLDFDGRPLVRFIIDESLRKGRFDVIAENVTSSVIRRLRAEEMEYYGISQQEPLSRPPARRAAISQDGPGQAPRRSMASRPDTDEPPARRPMATQPDDRQEAAQRNLPQQNLPYRGSPQQDLPYRGSPQQDLPQRGIPASALPKQQLPELPSLVPQYDREAAASVFQARSIGSDLTEEEAAPLPSAGKSSLTDLRDHTVYLLNRRNMSIGRGADNSIVLNDANASRAHAQLTQDATGTWKLTDLNSTNGTQLNDRPISQAFLSVGDRITIGLTTLEFNG